MKFGFCDAKKTSFGCLGAYGLKFFPSDWSAFDSKPNVDPDQIQKLAGYWSYVALLMFLLNYFFFCYGVSCVRNIYSDFYFFLLLFYSQLFFLCLVDSTVFTFWNFSHKVQFWIFYLISYRNSYNFVILIAFRTRSFCCVAVSVVGQLIEFASTKTFYNLEIWLSLSGVICFCGAVCLLGYEFFGIIDFQSNFLINWQKIDFFVFQTTCRLFYPSGDRESNARRHWHSFFGQSTRFDWH